MTETRTEHQAGDQDGEVDVETWLDELERADELGDGDGGDAESLDTEETVGDQEDAENNGHAENNGDDELTPDARLERVRDSLGMARPIEDDRR